MFKVILTCAAAALVISPLTLVPVARSLSYTGTVGQHGTPEAARKSDRLDVGARGGACADQPWPFHDSACLYDGLRPAGEVHKVRVVVVGRLPLAEEPR